MHSLIASRDADFARNGQGAECSPLRVGRSGLTLIEVVAGLVLMATLLVALVRATAVHRRNVVLAEERLEAIQYADRFLTKWSAEQRTQPTSQRGTVAGRANWVWQMRPVRTQELGGVRAAVWRLDIQRIQPRDTTLLASVEVLREHLLSGGRQ